MAVLFHPCLLTHPQMLGRALHVKGVCHHLLSPLQVGPQYKWGALHPGNEWFSLNGYLHTHTKREEKIYKVNPWIYIQCKIINSWILECCPIKRRQNSYRAIEEVFRYGYVVIGYDARDPSSVLRPPENTVEIWKILEDVISLLSPVAKGPVSHLWTLGGSREQSIFNLIKQQKGQQLNNFYWN